ncbi:MAG: nucleotidyltransferase family protein [Candidatus Eremiobacteraeota bacterium]|nr:nucleotidyltransferase family protein [Candidatus Eremiobacteraeota bacterium]
MGRPKQLVPIEGRPMVSQALTKYEASEAGEVILVLGHHQESIRESLGLCAGKTKVVVNREYREGMGSSIRCGMASLSPRSAAVLVALADKPFIEVATINGMIGFWRKSESSLLVPLHEGVRGHPVLFSRSLYPSLAALEGDRGGISVIERHGELLVEYVTSDRGVLIDIDTEGDLCLKGQG